MDKNKQVWDFMNAFIEDTSCCAADEYQQIEDRYTAMFGHVVPRDMIPNSISHDELKSAMLQCIDTKKDNLLELLNVKINPDHLY